MIAALKNRLVPRHIQGPIDGERLECAQAWVERLKGGTEKIFRDHGVLAGGGKNAGRREAFTLYQDGPGKRRGKK